MTVLLDLDPGSREALEYDALLEELAGLAVTAAGAERLRTWRPRAEATWIAGEHALVDEMLRLRARHGVSLPAGLPDPRPALEALRLEGSVPDGRTLRQLALCLEAAAGLRASLREAGAASWPRLRELVHAVELPQRLWREILRATDAEGEVLDDASPDLARVRRARRRAIERLRERLERKLRDPELAPFIQDEFITERQGRFVIPFRTDAPRRMPGIVHARSSSGATLFVEPLEAVEANNEIVELAEEEHRQVVAILRRWSEELRAGLPAVERAIEALVRWDTVEARARFAERYEAICPEPVSEPIVELREARHPRLEAHLRERGARPVPLDLQLRPPHRAVVLSGPNAGGKTVALKTVGLAVLLFQSGIPVPAREVRLPVFARLRADIGDHQSIDADLSTFSAHVAAVARFLREADPATLVLLDEPGTGTEPSEGAALAQAVLEQLLELEARTMATTHQGRIKSWALGHPHVLSAAMDFDVERMEPTYRLVADAAGVSAGLEIAARVGLPPGLVDRARRLLDPGTRAVESELRALRRRLEQLEREREALERARRQLEEERRALREAWAEERAAWRREADRRLAEAMEQARALLEHERQRLEQLVPAPVLERRVGRAAERVEARLRAAAAPAAEESREAAPAVLEPGRRVRVRSLGREGEIVEVFGARVRVRIGSATFTVPASELTAAASAGEPTSGPSTARLTVDAVSESAAELVLVGQRVEPALEQLDRFLDRAVLAGLREVRIVHGHGTGRLRAAVRRFLAEHPLVAEQRPGEANEGGEAVTVATLAER